MHTPIKKVLTFRASSIGDCLMGKYLLENIHAAYPEARCGIVVANRGEMIRNLFRAYPWLEVIEANRHDFHALFNLWKGFHDTDLSVTQYAGKIGGQFGLGSKIAARFLAYRGNLIGFQDASRVNNFLYDTLLPVKTDLAIAGHEREVLRAATIPASLPFPTLTFIHDESILSKYGLRADEFVIAHFFAGNQGKGIGPGMAQSILTMLIETFPPHVKILVTGSIEDAEAARALSGSARVIVVAGETTLQETTNLIWKCKGIVSVDTGVAHLAAHIQKPLVVIRSCLGPYWWFPEQYGKAPLAVLSRSDLCKEGHVKKDFPACINQVSIESIETALKKLVTI